MLTVSEAAALLDADVSTVRRRLEEGAMSGRRIHPRLWLISRDEVERWRGRVKRAPGRPRRAVESAENP